MYRSRKGKVRPQQLDETEPEKAVGGNGLGQVFALATDAEQMFDEDEFERLVEK